VQGLIKKVTFEGFDGALNIFERYDSVVWAFFFMQTLQSIAWSIISPFLSIYLKTSFGISASMIGALYMITGIVGVFSAPVCGGLCDRLNRKSILVFGGIVSVIGNVILAVMAMVNTNFYTFSFVFIARSIFGGWSMIAMSAMLADIISSQKRLEVYGLMGAGSNTGFAIGSLLGGFLTASSSLIFFLSAVFMIPPLLISLFFIKGTAPKPETLATSNSGFLQFLRNIIAVMRNRVAISFLGILTLLGLVWGQFYGLFPIYAEKFVGISSSEMGVAYALEGAIMAVFSYSISRWATKFNLVTVYGIGAGLFSLSVLGVGVMPSLTGILLFYSVIEAFAEMFCTPTSNAIMAALAPEGQRGMYMGVLSLFQRTQSSYAPLIGGILMDHLAPQFLLFWLFFTAIGLIATALCLPLKKMAKSTFKSD